MIIAFVLFLIAVLIVSTVISLFRKTAQSTFVDLCFYLLVAASVGTIYMNL